MTHEKAVEMLETAGALWAPYGHPADGYSVAFGWDYDERGCVFYYAAFCKHALPPFRWEIFDSAEELAARVLELQPDVGRWREVPDEGAEGDELVIQGEEPVSPLPAKI